MEENKNPEPSSREWNGKQRIRRAMVALLFCLGPHCFGPEGTSTGNGDPNTSQIPVETVVNTSEKSITPPYKKILTIKGFLLHRRRLTKRLLIQ